MNRDKNTQAVLFRLRHGDPPNRTFDDMRDFSLTTYGRPYEPSRNQVGTILGERNGVPDHQSQNIYILQDHDMNQRTRFPYNSKEPKHLLPTVYNGTVNMLASSGGAPLAYALMNESELQQRLFSEGMRASELNPLSAKFAWNARKRTFDNVVQGPATDIMRRELAGNEDDPVTTERKIKSGHFGGRRPTHITEDTQIDPEIEAFRNQHRPPTRADFLDFRNLFTAPVGRITGSTVHNVASINARLNRIRPPGGYQMHTPSAPSPPGSASGSSTSSPGWGPGSFQMRAPSAPPAPGSVSGSSRSSNTSSGWGSIMSRIGRQANQSSLQSMSPLSSVQSSFHSMSPLSSVQSGGIHSMTPLSSISGSSNNNLSLSSSFGGSAATPVIRRRRKDPLSRGSQRLIGIQAASRNRRASTQQVRFSGRPRLRASRSSGGSSGSRGNRALNFSTLSETFTI